MTVEYLCHGCRIADGKPHLLCESVFCSCPSCSMSNLKPKARVAMTQGTKFDQAKPRWYLFPWEAAEQVVLVLNHGAEKYDVGNWRRDMPRADERLSAAAIRHLQAWIRGELADPDSGLPHLAHAGCCVLMLLELELQGQLPKERSPR